MPLLSTRTEWEIVFSVRNFYQVTQLFPKQLCEVINKDEKHTYAYICWENTNQSKKYSNKDIHTYTYLIKFIKILFSKRLYILKRRSIY